MALSTNQIVTTIVAVMVVAVFLGFFGFLWYLHYRNSHPKPIPDHKIPKWIKYTKIFIGSILLELIGLVFFCL